MRADLTLTPDAAAALARAMDEAARRMHVATTPLHVAAALLAAPAGLLRQACARAAAGGAAAAASGGAGAHPLHCRALELCFSVALDRLPALAGGAAKGGGAAAPPASNALVAALKRAQAQPRRGCPEAAQQPLLAVKVELEQLVLSILDDPSVSRVMRQASFSSAAVKNTIEQSLTSPSPSSSAAVSSPAATPTPFSPSPSPFPRPDVHKVLDVMLKPARRNPVLVGDAGPDATLKEVIRRISTSICPALAAAKILRLEAELANLAGDKVAMAERIVEVGAVVDRLVVEHGGVVLDLGDLKWLVEGPAAASSEGGKAAVAEMGRLRGRFGRGVVWAVATAACATYLRCKIYYPGIEDEWDLQAVPIARSTPIAGPALRLVSSTSHHVPSSLESILHGQSSRPLAIPYHHLQNITDNFSDERILGQGGSGVVYKGVLQNGETIAVKKIVSSLMPGLQKKFENEVYHLMMLKHPNIVRCVGYCYETRHVCLEEYNGKPFFAEMSERLLCLEYIPNKSLDKYITDESSGLHWSTRYKIIEGICYGLCHLHVENGKPIIHLDLKPANILLDDGMVSKITDFGLSRLLDQQKTIYTKSRDGTLGYMAPEFLHGGTITLKSDIFSLGVIIIEVVTGNRDYPDVTRTSSDGFIKLVLNKWRNVLAKSSLFVSLERDCKQIERCIQVGLICVNPDRTKRPPIAKIINMLQGAESINCDTIIQTK